MNEDALLGTVTILLRHVADARDGSMDQLFDRVYPELKRLAGHILDRRARGRRSVSATALVNSACERLLAAEALKVNDRRHFFRLFCKAMENEWVDCAITATQRLRTPPTSWSVHLRRYAATGRTPRAGCMNG